MNVYIYVHIYVDKSMESYTNKNIRKISKTGRGSYYVIIPKEMIKNLNWREKRKVILKQVKKQILISDYK